MLKIFNLFEGQVKINVMLLTLHVLSNEPVAILSLQIQKIEEN